MDTKFSVALHILAMIAEGEKNLSSQALANSVGTNASYIRKVIALLKHAGLISSHQGRVGYALTRAVADISLLDIYFATQEIDRVSLFQVHQHANPACPVGRYIEGAIRPVFQEVEVALTQQLKGHNLADIIDHLYAQAGRIRKA